MDTKKTVEVTVISDKEKKMDAFIETYSGIKVYFMNPKPEMILIEDIAHSLSNICRFTGHTKEFFSVAQHSVMVADQQTTLAEKRAGLLHDATEAYVSDLPSPFKVCADLGDYKTIEDRFHDVINQKFNINEGMTPNIKKADLSSLLTERRDLFRTEQDWGDWTNGIELYDETIVPLLPKQAKALFLKRFYELFPEYK